jgi:hypothetical protein
MGIVARKNNNFAASDHVVLGARLLNTDVELTLNHIVIDNEM